MINFIRWKLARLWKVLIHPMSKCKIEDCELCGVLDCPGNRSEHYWHDGCPYCWGEEQRKKKLASNG